MKVKSLGKVFAALAFSLTLALPVCAAPSSLGVTVAVQDGYSCDYGVDIPFTRSARTQDYTFALYAGSTAAGTPTVKAEVAITPTAQVNVHLPLRHDAAAPSTWTLRVTAHVAPGREAFDREASADKTFVTPPSCGCAAGTAGAYYVGTGTAASPFRVATPAQLAHVNNHLAASFIQTQDIRLSGNWTPLGGGSYNKFTGVYDGKGYVVHDLQINCRLPCGLFGSIYGATVQNLGLESSKTIQGIYTGSDNLVAVGALVGSADRSTIRYCYVNAKVTGPPGYTGSTSGTISTAGMMVGNAENGTLVSNCYAYGQLTNSNWHGGGLVGRSNTGMTIENCYAVTGVPNGHPQGTGGLLGYSAVPGSTPIRCSYWLNGQALAAGNNSASLTSVSRLTAGSQLASQGTFSGWDFSNVWTIGSVRDINYTGSTYTAPVLRVFNH